MPASIKNQLAHINDKQEEKDLRVLFESFRADTAALRASIVAITAKLDADGGVTDTNYAATTNPPALSVTL